MSFFYSKILKMTIDFAINDFISHCQFEKKLSPKTIKAYRIDLRQFKIHLKNKSLLSEVSKQEIKGYLVSISPLKPKSIKRKIATIKALFNYLEFDDKIEVNPFRKIRIKIKDPHSLRVVMDIQEIKKIFKSAYEKKQCNIDTTTYSHFECLRNIVVFELLFSTGARVSEIAELQKNCINLETGLILIKGKGDKERIVQICNIETLSILKTYFNYYEEKISQNGGWFLINRNYKKISDQSIRNIVHRMVKNAGVIKHITPHIFRHTFATLLLEKNVDIKYIQSLLGHSSITTTQIYTHINQNHQREILTTKHPRGDFSFETI